MVISKIVSCSLARELGEQMFCFSKDTSRWEIGNRNWVYTRGCDNANVTVFGGQDVYIPHPDLSGPCFGSGEVVLQEALQFLLSRNAGDGGALTLHREPARVRIKVSA